MIRRISVQVVSVQLKTSTIPRDKVLVRVNMCLKMYTTVLFVLCFNAFSVYGQLTNQTLIHCRSCQGARTLAECTSEIACVKSIEECYMDELITSQLTIAYAGGCRAKDVCSQNMNPAAIGKRDALVACSRCCDDADRCNDFLCGINNATILPTLAPMPGSVRCKLCNRVNDLSQCYGSITCDNITEECYMEELITKQLTIVYNSGCRSKQVCQLAAKRTPRDLVACSNCCNDYDNCNQDQCGIKIGYRLTTLNVIEGQGITMTCPGPYSIVQTRVTWSKAGGPVIATGPTFENRHVSLSDAGDYTCKYFYDGAAIDEVFHVHIKQKQILNPLKCKECAFATDLSECRKTVTCDGSLEYCYMDELVTDQLTIVYDGGCRAKDVCNGHSGKKRGDLLACSRCCSYQDECNAGICGIKSGKVLPLQVNEGSQFMFNCSDDSMAAGQTVSWTKVNSCVGVIKTDPVYRQQYANVADTGVYVCSHYASGRKFTETFEVIVKPSGPGPQTCNLDSGSLCGWQQGASDQFDWTFISGPTQSSGTGPPADHTTGTAAGKYLYIESSSPQVAGNIATLESPIQPANTSRCFQFWYYMHGNGIGDLHVSLQDICKQTDTQIYKQVGEQGARWQQASMTITNDKVPNDYRIVIKGIVGTTYTGDISIDDLVLSDGSCAGTQGTIVG